MESYVTPLPRVFVWPEWTVVDPVWGDGEELTLADVGASHRLTERMWAWREQWELNFSLDDGWPTVKMREEWFERGHALTQELASELAGRFEVRPDFEIYQQVRETSPRGDTS